LYVDFEIMDRQRPSRAVNHLASQRISVMELGRVCAWKPSVFTISRAFGNRTFDWYRFADNGMLPDKIP
jgi:hypothetical protein